MYGVTVLSNICFKHVGPEKRRFSPRDFLIEKSAVGNRSQSIRHRLYLWLNRERVLGTIDSVNCIRAQNNAERGQTSSYRSFVRQR